MFQVEMEEEKQAKLEDLYSRAEQLRQAGRQKDVVPICEEILKLEPKDTNALGFMSTWHSGQGNFEEALKYLRPFNRLMPNQENMMLTLGIALEETGKPEEAKRVYQRTLKLNDSNFFTYIYLGNVLEKLGDKEKAAWSYSYAVDLNPALKTIPAGDRYPEIAKKRVAQSNEFLKKEGQNLHKKAIEKAKEKYPKGDYSRIEKAVWRKLHDAKVGIKNMKQQPLSFYIPDLDRGPWFERDEFDWVDEVEKDYNFIRKEILRTYKGDADTKPYLQAGGYDARTWGDLVGSREWAAIHLYDGMKRKEANCQKFSETAKLIEDFPLFRIKGNPVEVLFSLLKPNTEIPPHFGTSNARLTVHLPLVVPEGCYVKADEEERNVEAGKCLIFDDSFRHNARNTSDEVRIVLIFEVWHPDLREEERAVIEETYSLFEDWMMARDHDALLDA